MDFIRKTLIFAALCAPLVPHGLSAQIPDVVVSLKPIHSLVAGVMGDAGKPRLLLKGTASPHTYQMRPSDARALAEADLIVNSTSVGMQGGSAGSVSPLRADLIPASSLVYDMVYNPARTPLLKQAAGAGAASLGGLPMLVYQGAGSFELWTGLAAPVEVMFEAAKEALERMRL